LLNLKQGDFCDPDSLSNGFTTPKDKNTSGLQIYPNPATDKLMMIIIMNNTENEVVQLYSVLGQLQKQTLSDQNSDFYGFRFECRSLLY